ncbi:MAG: S8 family serine peptidase [Gemmataceae bacterium]
MSPLDEAFALLTPDRLLRNVAADGRGIRVAIIDSGIDSGVLQSRHPQLAAIESYTFRGPNPQATPHTGPPSSPHGTTVADIVLKLAPGSTLLSLDVFGPTGGDVDAVVSAIRFATTVGRVHIVNLSLGIAERTLQNAPKRQALSRVVEEAYYAGVSVIAAANNDHPFSISYPAGFGPPLVGVDKGLFDDPLKFAYEIRERVEFRAHGRGDLGPFAREPATSWATPHVTGIVAKLLSLNPDLKPFEIKALLYRLARSMS